MTQAHFTQLHYDLERQVHTLSAALDRALERISALERERAQTDEYLDTLNQRDQAIFTRLTKLETHIY